MEMVLTGDADLDDGHDEGEEGHEAREDVRGGWQRRNHKDRDVHQQVADVVGGLALQEQ